MKLNKSMETNHFLGRGIYLMNNADSSDIVFIDNQYSKAGRKLKKYPQYVVIDHPIKINNCIVAIINKMISEFSDIKSVEHSFNGVIDVYNNIIALQKNDNLLQIAYLKNNKINTVILSSDYKINNLNSYYKVVPKYRTSMNQFCFEFEYEYFSISQINKMLEIVYEK